MTEDSYKYRIILNILIMMVFAHAQSWAKTYIVCIGIQNYPKQTNDLTLPVRDAVAIKKLYEKKGDVVSVLLTDKQATRANIVNAMRSLFHKSKPNDVVVLFFSGHGAKGALRAYDDYLNYRVVWDCLLSARARLCYALIDACHSGSMRRKDIISKLKGKNIMFFLSSRSGETSIEDIRLKNGIFTTSLIQGLGGLADLNKDFNITAKELYDFVSKNVKRISNGAQHPVMWGDFDDEMSIMKWK